MSDQGKQAEQDVAFKPRVVAFVCNWCTYVGADGAGTARLQYRPEVIPIRLQCTGRIDPLFIIKAMEQGADGVIVSGCHPGDCHYVAGNYYARRRFQVFRALLDFMGVDLRRVQFAWVSATEGTKWAAMVNEFVDRIAQLGPNRSPRMLGDFSPFTKSTAKPLIEPTRAPAPSASYQATEVAVRHLAHDLLERKEVGVVVGYGKAGVRGYATPTFITQPDEADKLCFNDKCINNLSVYLTKDLVTKLGKVAIVAKGCDVRSIIGLIQENQIAREDVKIIGVQCQGVVLVDGQLLSKCVDCKVRTPHLADYVAPEVSPAPSAEATAVTPELAAQVAAVLAMPVEQRWAWWQEQFARCTKCYGCRGVCPMCYCDKCIVEKNRPQWILPSAHGKGVFTWMFTRAFHQAGRCVQCGECQRVCPSGIRLDLLNARVAMEIEKVYGHVAGQSLDTVPPLQTFKTNDDEQFIK